MWLPFRQCYTKSAALLYDTSLYWEKIISFGIENGRIFPAIFNENNISDTANIP